MTKQLFGIFCRGGTQVEVTSSLAKVELEGRVTSNWQYTFGGEGGGDYRTTMT
jgi:hypothetical protein